MTEQTQTQIIEGRPDREKYYTVYTGDPDPARVAKDFTAAWGCPPATIFKFKNLTWVGPVPDKHTAEVME